MVKIWGKWCGPNWTGGQRVSAQDYTGSWLSRCIDNLDCACRNHDRDAAHPQGNSRKADDALLKVARSVSTNAITRLFNKSKAQASDKIIAAITIARRTRKR